MIIKILYIIAMAINIQNNRNAMNIALIYSILNNNIYQNIYINN